jgi:hypothetical protein
MKTREEKIIKQLQKNVADGADLMRGMRKYRLCKCLDCNPQFIRKVYQLATENGMSIRAKELI